VAGLGRAAVLVRAAVLHGFGTVPRYEEFPDPEPGPDDTVIDVRAVALELHGRRIVVIP
jgi:NADPH:quinone reductase-like Zn-dependent oxidoreductase